MVRDDLSFSGSQAGKETLMDNKRLIVVLLVSTLLMMVWMVGLPWIAAQFGVDLTPQKDEPVAEATVEEPTQRPDPLAPASLDPAVDTPATSPTSQPGDPAQIRVLTQAEPATFILGSATPDDERFALGLTLNTLGAGVDGVVLSQIRQEVNSDERYVFQLPYPEQPQATRPLATPAVQVMGKTIDLASVPWAVSEPVSGEGGTHEVTFHVDIGTDAGPLLRVRKLVRVYPRITADGEPDLRGGYEIFIRETLENLSDQPLTVRSSLNGPTTPPRELEYGYDRMVIAGFRGRNLAVDYEAWTIDQFTDEDERRRILTQEMPPLLWAGASTIYFGAIVRPEPLGEPAGGDVATPQFLGEVVAANITPEAETPHVALRFHTKDLELAPGASQILPWRVFLGPKERGLLNNDYFAGVGRRYDETLVSPFGCTWCVFQPVVNVLVWLLTAFYMVVRDWGLAIILLVVVVRLLLHPITKRSQRSMMRMAKLGPEMEKLKKKYGDDREAMAKAMQEFYREHGMAALPLGCLPMLLQTPIWIALYSTLQAEFRLRLAPFLYGWTWIDDLAKPDNLIDFGTTFNLFFFSIHGLNLLPILLAGVFYFQMKLQPTPAAMTPEQQTQQNIMKWMMVLMFPLFLYQAPSGLNLYILTSTCIGIWESKRIRDQFKREEEEQAAVQPTLVKDKAPRTARGKKRDHEKQTKPAPTGWRAKVAQFQENLQKQVEQAQKEAAKRGSDRKR